MLAIVDSLTMATTIYNYVLESLRNELTGKFKACETQQSYVNYFSITTF